MYSIVHTKTLDEAIELEQIAKLHGIKIYSDWWNNYKEHTVIDLVQRDYSTRQSIEVTDKYNIISFTDFKNNPSWAIRRVQLNNDIDGTMKIVLPDVEKKKSWFTKFINLFK